MAAGVDGVGRRQHRQTTLFMDWGLGFGGCMETLRSPGCTETRGPSAITPAEQKVENHDDYELGAKLIRQRDAGAQVRA